MSFCPWCGEDQTEWDPTGEDVAESCETCETGVDPAWVHCAFCGEVRGGPIVKENSGILGQDEAALAEAVLRVGLQVASNALAGPVVGSVVAAPLAEYASKKFRKITGR